MLAINHALTGALIGLSVQRPLVAVPAALISHFVCDMIPHFGGASDDFLKTLKFRIMLRTDIALCFLLVGVLAVSQPDGWPFASLTAFIATSPDFAWLPGYLRVQHGKTFRQPAPSLVLQFLAHIQWFERPIGGFVEAAWATGAVVLLVAYL